MSFSKADLEGWRSHPVTERFFEDIEQAKIDAQGSSRMYASPDITLMMACKVEGQVMGYTELEQWYEELKEDFETDEN